MSNLRAAPDWLTDDMVVRVQAGMDRSVAIRLLVQLDLTDGEISLIERIATAAGMTPNSVARGMIRAGLPAGI